MRRPAWRWARLCTSRRRKRNNLRMQSAGLLKRPALFPVLGSENDNGITAPRSGAVIPLPSSHRSKEHLVNKQKQEKRRGNSRGRSARAETTEPALFFSGVSNLGKSNTRPVGGGYAEQMAGIPGGGDRHPNPRLPADPSCAKPPGHRRCPPARRVAFPFLRQGPDLQ